MDETISPHAQGEAPSGKCPVDHAKAFVEAVKRLSVTDSRTSTD